MDDVPIASGMTSHVHMIISDMKKHISSALKAAIKNHPQESRRERMLWIMERAGKKNGNNKDWQFWQRLTAHLAPWRGL